MNTRINKAVESHLDSGYFKSGLYLNDIEVFLNAQMSGDNAGGEDVTTSCLSIEGQDGQCRIVSKDEGLFCGGEEVKYYFEKCSGMDLVVSLLVSDGDYIHSGDVLINVSGRIGDLFLAERVMMNIVQRMSGIATVMNKYRLEAGSDVLICPTRKTLLGALDKKACMIGGGGTHRLGLHDAVLFKKTHINSVGRDYEKLLRLGFTVKESIKFIECEVESTADALCVIDIFRDLLVKGFVKHQFIVMFDNLRPEEIGPFIKDLRTDMRNEVLFEASGSIDIDNVSSYVKSGVDIISVGKITNGVGPLDFSFKLSS